MDRLNLYFANVRPTLACQLVLAAVVQLFRRSSRSGAHRDEFERDMAAAVGVGDTVAVPANRSGLFALLKGMGVGAGDEVILTGYTCSAVPEPVLQVGAVPVYVDIDTHRFGMSPQALKQAITPRTRLIILQHTYGFAAPVGETMEIARSHGLPVVEDCALAFGSRRNGQWLGAFGDAAVWSFELSKTLSVGWGGLVAVNHDADLAARVRSVVTDAGHQRCRLAAQRLFQAGVSGFLYHPTTPALVRKFGLAGLFKTGVFRASADTPASSLEMPSDIQWLFLKRQLQSLPAILAASRTAQAAYERVLTSHGITTMPSDQATTEEYLIRFPLLVQDPARCVAFFAQRGIEVGRWFNRPVSGGSGEDYGYTPGSCPTAEWVCRHIVNLPLHARLRSKDVEAVAALLDEYLIDYPDEVGFMKEEVVQ